MPEKHDDDTEWTISATAEEVEKLEAYPMWKIVKVVNGFVVIYEDGGAFVFATEKTLFNWLSKQFKKD